MRTLRLIWVSEKAKYFLRRGWTDFAYGSDLPVEAGQEFVCLYRRQNFYAVCRFELPRSFCHQFGTSHKRKLSSTRSRGDRILAQPRRAVTLRSRGAPPRHIVIARSTCDEAIHPFFSRRDGLLRGACHRARVRATRWLAMTPVRRDQACSFIISFKIASPICVVETAVVPSDLMSAVRRPLASTVAIAASSWSASGPMSKE